MMCSASLGIRAEQHKYPAPADSLIGHSETDSLVLLRTGDEGIRVQQRERLPELTLRIPLELFATDRKWLEQTCYGDRRPSLMILSDGDVCRRFKCAYLTSGLALLTLGLPRPFELDDGTHGSFRRCGSRDCYGFCQGTEG